MINQIAVLKRVLLVLAVALSAQSSTSMAAEDDTALAPHVLLRSLQFVQDTVVLGDHSAGEMQRYMLDRIDKALRSVDPSVYNDPRNVDAVLIYAMSGGNPMTLEYLDDRDIAGNFDTRIADALRKYLNGQGTLVAKTLGDMAKEYRSETIAPYIALVSGNVTVPQNPKAALAFFDMARLGAPGTIVEEAALRRSVAIAADADLVKKGLSYSRKYARRFVHSPYASQFVDFFVQLVVEHFPQVEVHDIDGTVEFMDVDRRREVFLRIARQAALEGKTDLGRLASARAIALSGLEDEAPDVLAKLYRGVAAISTANIDAAMKDLAEIPADELSPRDRALREAARVVAEEVLREPVAESLAQGVNPIVAPVIDAVAVDAVPVDDMSGSTSVETVLSENGGATTSPEFKTFVDDGRAKLSAIDELLSQEGVGQ